MGDKRPSIRTLPDGSKVMHHPPDKHHPEGRLTLIRERSVLKDRHDERLGHHRHRHAALKAHHERRIYSKKTDQEAKGVPGAKSPF